MSEDSAKEQVPRLQKTKQTVPKAPNDIFECGWLWWPLACCILLHFHRKTKGVISLMMLFAKI